MENNSIFKKLIAVMNDVEAITKSRKNQQQGYSFRGIDDVMNELHVHFAKEGIVIMPEVMEERREQLTNKNGTTLLYSFVKVKYTFYAEDGSNVSAIGIGEAMDSGDKATNKAQSSALKYVLLQSLLIPTEETKDVENDSPEIKAAPKQIAQTPAKKQYPSIDLQAEMESLYSQDELVKYYNSNPDRHTDKDFMEALSIRKGEIAFSKNGKKETQKINQ